MKYAKERIVNIKHHNPIFMDFKPTNLWSVYWKKFLEDETHSYEEVVYTTQLTTGTHSSLGMPDLLAVYKLHPDIPHNNNEVSIEVYALKEGMMDDSCHIHYYANHEIIPLMVHKRIITMGDREKTVQHLLHELTCQIQLDRLESILKSTEDIGKIIVTRVSSNTKLSNYVSYIQKVLDTTLDYGYDHMSITAVIAFVVNAVRDGKKK